MESVVSTACTALAVAPWTQRWERVAAALQQGAAAVVGDSASGAAAVLHPDFGTAADVCANKAPRAVTETYGACAAEASEQAGAAAGARSGGDDGSVPELLGYACDAFMPHGHVSDAASLLCYIHSISIGQRRISY